MMLTSVLFFQMISMQCSSIRKKKMKIASITSKTTPQLLLKIKVRHIISNFVALNSRAAKLMNTIVVTIRIAV